MCRLLKCTNMCRVLEWKSAGIPMLEGSRRHYYSVVIAQLHGLPYCKQSSRLRHHSAWKQQNVSPMFCMRRKKVSTIYNVYMMHVPCQRRLEANNNQYAQDCNDLSKSHWLCHNPVKRQQSYSINEPHCFHYILILVSITWLWPYAVGAICFEDGFWTETVRQARWLGLGMGFYANGGCYKWLYKDLGQYWVGYFSLLPKWGLENTHLLGGPSLPLYAL